MRTKTKNQEYKTIPLEQDFGTMIKGTEERKQVCNFCGDFIVGFPRYIERPCGKRKGYITYNYFVIDEGCQLLLEAKGLVEDVFLQDISPIA